MLLVFIECTTDTIGCSEEQSYQDMVNIPIYIKVKHIDLFKVLKISFAGISEINLQK